MVAGCWLLSAVVVQQCAACVYGEVLRAVGVVVCIVVYRSLCAATHLTNWKRAFALARHWNSVDQIFWEPLVAA